MRFSSVLHISVVTLEPDIDICLCAKRALQGKKRRKHLHQPNDCLSNVCSSGVLHAQNKIQLLQGICILTFHQNINTVIISSL